MLLPLPHRIAILPFLMISACALGQNIPKGYIVPDSTISPDHRYGVTVPLIAENDESAKVKNSLVELKTGRVLAVIRAETGWDHMNHGGVDPKWSKDGSLLLWMVDGKWCPRALVLLKLADGKVLWQTDILSAGQQAILVRTKKAAAEKYAAAKKANADNGSAYPDGFTVDVEAADPLSLPLHIQVTLTSNPKELPDLPNLDSHLEGVVDSDGKFIVKSFHLGRMQ